MAAPAAQNAGQPAPAPFEHKLVKFDLEGHFHYTFTVDLELDLSDAELDEEFELKGVPLAGNWQSLDLSATPHNVRLFFPQHDADLWAESAFLTRSSPYFRTLLSSEFAEAVTVPAKRARTRSSSAAATRAADFDEGQFDDSDGETDELYFKNHPPQLSEGHELQHPYKEIQITKTAFSTYRAVLAYLRTGFIAVAPLSSTFCTGDDAGAPSRSSRIEATVASNPSLPYPVSPKSAFRLGHLLELKDLEQLCLANFSKQLTVDCAPDELFSDTSKCYDSWREVVLKYVVENWDAVTATASWDIVAVNLRNDAIPGTTPIMLELLELKAAKPA